MIWTGPGSKKKRIVNGPTFRGKPAILSIRAPSGIAPNRVQGHPGQGVQGAECLLPAGGLAVEGCLKEWVSKRGQRVVCPLTNPRGFQCERRVLNAGTTKGTSVVSNGSSQECLRRQGVAPLTPGCRGTLGLSDGRRAGNDAVRASGTLVDADERASPPYALGTPPRTASQS